MKPPEPVREPRIKNERCTMIGYSYCYDYSGDDHVSANNYCWGYLQ